MKTKCLALLTLMGLAIEARAQDAPARVNPAPPGVKVGEKAPGFKLKDQSAKDRSLDEFLAEGKLALVFYRSAAW